MASIPGKRWLRREIVSFALVAAAALQGCSGKGCACSWPFSPRENTAQRAYTDVEMLAPGVEPRVTLRVARWSGLRYRSTLTASGALGFEGAPPLVSPTTTLVIDNEVLRGTADPIVEWRDGGVFRLIEERSVLHAIKIYQEGAPPAVLDFWNQALAPVRGTSYVQHVAESAAVASLSSEMLGGLRPPPEITAALDRALEGQRHVPFRLPPAPVGVGARWRFREALELNGAHAFQLAEMTLRSIDANVAVIGIAIRQDAPRQTVPHPLVPGATATLEQFRGDGGGELTVDRLTAIAVQGRISVTAHSTLSADVGGQHNVATLIGASTLQLVSRLLMDDDAGADPAAGAR
jgi:hypothetical protein